MTNHSLNEDISEIKKKDILQFCFTINDTMFKRAILKTGWQELRTRMSL